MEETRMIGQPVRSLQLMLGVLAQHNETMPFVTADGVFGEATLEAVMVFQREHCPPVTGRVDQKTWDAIVLQYRNLTQRTALPRRLSGFPAGSFQIAMGDSGDTAALVQVMFRSLSSILEQVEQHNTDGTCGKQEHNNICWLQRCCKMEESGVMDRCTWNMLTRVYDMFVVRRTERELCRGH